jgi:small-conductance mechanosensitive channel
MILSENILAILSKILMVAASFYATWLLQRFAIKAFNAWIRRQDEAEQMDQMVASFIKIIFKVILWIIVTLFVLQNLGLQITALLGGLGVAGLAVAFAFQRVLEDVFSFFLIYFDKPFKVGDYIMVGADAGTVKNIGVRTTKLTTPAGQELLISNRELTNSRLQNFKKMKKRRAALTFGVTYDTSVEKLATAKKLVVEIFSKLDQDLVELDRVHLKELADSALLFEVVYHVLNKEYADYMNVQEQVNLALLAGLKKHKIELAFPTQTIHLHKAA